MSSCCQRFFGLKSRLAVAVALLLVSTVGAETRALAQIASGPAISAGIGGAAKPMASKDIMQSHVEAVGCAGNSVVPQFEPVEVKDESPVKDETPVKFSLNPILLVSLGLGVFIGALALVFSRPNMNRPGTIDPSATDREFGQAEVLRT